MLGNSAKAVPPVVEQPVPSTGINKAVGVEGGGRSGKGYC